MIYWSDIITYDYTIAFLRKRQFSPGFYFDLVRKIQFLVLMNREKPDHRERVHLVDYTVFTSCDGYQDPFMSSSFASASISTRSSGSASPSICSMVAAGRISAKISPCARPTAS